MYAPDGKMRARNIQNNDGAVVETGGFNSGNVGGFNSGNANNFNSGNVGNNGGFKAQKIPSVEATPTGENSSGIIKSYNPQKGFGFITAEGLPTDVFFMKSDLPVEAQNEDC